MAQKSSFKPKYAYEVESDGLIVYRTNSTIDAYAKGRKINGSTVWFWLNCKRHLPGLGYIDEWVRMKE